MRDKSCFLQQHARAKAAINEIIEMPNMQIDRIIRSTETNQGRLSNALAKEIPSLTEPGPWDAITEAIGVAFLRQQIQIPIALGQPILSADRHYLTPPWGCSSWPFPCDLDCRWTQQALRCQIQRQSVRNT